MWISYILYSREPYTVFDSTLSHKVLLLKDSLRCDPSTWFSCTDWIHSVRLRLHSGVRVFGRVTPSLSLLPFTTPVSRIYIGRPSNPCPKHPVLKDPRVKVFDRHGSMTSSVPLIGLLPGCECVHRSGDGSLLKPWSSLKFLDRTRSISVDSPPITTLCLTLSENHVSFTSTTSCPFPVVLHHAPGDGEVTIPGRPSGIVVEGTRLPAFLRTRIWSTSDNPNGKTEVRSEVEGSLYFPVLKPVFPKVVHNWIEPFAYQSRFST